MDYGYCQILVPVISGAVAFLCVLHVLFSMKDEAEWGMFWLILILALPPLGVILYLFVGISRKNTFGKRILHSIRNFTSRQDQNALKNMVKFREALQPFLHHTTRDFFAVERLLDRLLENDMIKYRSAQETAGVHKRSFHSCSGNSVELFCDGTEGYPAMLQAIRSARKHIHLQSYIFANDPVGRAILAALRERAAAGVEVRVLFDRLGSFSSAWQLIRHCSRKKFPTLHIRPFSHSSLFTPWRFQLRNHRKLLIVDGETAFTGGLNISHENVRTSSREGIHDYHCRIQGPSVGELQYAFLCDWIYAMGKRHADLDPAKYFSMPRKCGDNRIGVMTSGHGYHFKGSEKVFFTAAARARKSLWIITPYFVPPHDFSKALRIACARGVDVRIIVPAVSDHWYVKMASAHYYETLLGDSVRIFERQKVFSHAKAMLVDGKWAYLGSSNCDCRSFNLNFELDLLVGEGDFSRTLYNQFLKEFEASKEITFADLKRNVLRKLVQSLCALACPVL